MADVLLHNDGNLLITPAGDVATDADCCCDDGGGACGCPSSVQPTSIAVVGFAIGMFTPDTGTGFFNQASAQCVPSPGVWNGVMTGYYGSVPPPSGCAGTPYTTYWASTLIYGPGGVFNQMAPAGVIPAADGKIYGYAACYLNRSSDGGTCKWVMECWYLTNASCPGPFFIPNYLIFWQGIKATGATPLGVYNRVMPVPTSPYQATFPTSVTLA